MKEKLNKAVALRKNGDFKQSNAMLSDLAALHPDDAIVNYQCACSFDVIGEEAEAVTYYEKAITLGLKEEDLKGALLGLGSSYRTLGEYEKSQAVFQEGIKQFPNDHAMKVFFAMTLYNLQEHGQAMELLLTTILKITDDSDILAYQKAISYYADELDRTWT
ncbi:tetratricopeptide repeat protein [Virgibacillus sp. 179-BFC.A HS]|uniref:Tetratricopeptide repeat protein n=1 Tax=Tigheibacillus jepli TaxID=3035914 RepID=A0ABU5CII8_9BACI|nr:tetratricopeptide repeat protein [Virgibacillus sp. 179-BFC.A HS]MDY0405338.1 tetratricopeptide repeat protein [Virgibacillus sp. 179-BFC.A HS]